MTFKTAAQIFGDGAGNGAAVPYSTTNPPGTAAANRGIQFGEQLTAAIANRTSYALALNDEDLNTRLGVFEVDGLDAAYRNGAFATAGGGRIITLDGGAVETRSAFATPLADDKTNAHYRADATGDTADGGGGFEFTGLVGSAQHVARYGIMDRRAFPLNTARTVVGIAQAAVLNLASVGGDAITLSSGQWKDGSNNTDLIPQLDMVEILSGSFAGVYVIEAFSTGTRATLRHLNGATPAFTADTAVTFRLCRPTFVTASPFSHSGTSVMRGVTLVGTPTDDVSDALLNLVPAGRGGLDADGTDGFPWALRIKRATAAGATSNVFSITSSGSVRSFTTVEDKTITGAAGVDFGAPGFHHAPNPASPTYEVSFLGLPNETSLAQYYGHLALERGVTETFEFIGTGDGFEFTPTSGEISDVHNGQIIEVLTPSDQRGYYRILDCDISGSAPYSVTVEQLDGTNISGWPTSGPGTFRSHTGMVAGRFSLKVPTSTMAVGLGGGAYTIQDDVHASMMVTAPRKNAAAGATSSDVALVMVCRDVAHDAFFRCFIQDQEVAALTSEGHLSIDGDFRGGAISANGAITGTSLASGSSVTAFSGSGFLYTTPPTRTVMIPLTSLIPTPIAEWSLSTDSPSNVYDWFTLAPNGSRYLTGEIRVPDGCTFTRLRVGVEQQTTAAADMNVEVFLADYDKASASITTSTSTLSSLGTDTAADDGVDILSVTVSQVIASATQTIVFKILCSDAGTDVDYVRWVEAQFTDIGPRNN